MGSPLGWRCWNRPPQRFLPTDTRGKPNRQNRPGLSSALTGQNSLKQATKEPSLRLCTLSLPPTWLPAWDKTASPSVLKVSLMTIANCSIRSPLTPSSFSTPETQPSTARFSAYPRRLFRAWRSFHQTTFRDCYHRSPDTVASLSARTAPSEFRTSSGDQPLSMSQDCDFDPTGRAMLSPS